MPPLSNLTIRSLSPFGPVGQKQPSDGGWQIEQATPRSTL